MTAKTFKELEHGGWRDKAAAYDSYFALHINQAIAEQGNGNAMVFFQATMILSCSAPCFKFCRRKTPAFLSKYRDSDMVPGTIPA